jgi:DNA-binding NarL/FixJ family response regulator
MLLEQMKKKWIHHLQEIPFMKDETALLITTLTKREFELLILLMDAPSNKELATKLGITVKSVENCKTRIGEKLNQPGKHALLKVAIKYRSLLEPLKK